MLENLQTRGWYFGKLYLFVWQSCKSACANGYCLRWCYDNEYNYFACPHPGILMRESDISKKWKNVLVTIIDKVKVLL